MTTDTRARRAIVAVLVVVGAACQSGGAVSLQPTSTSSIPRTSSTTAASPATQEHPISETTVGPDATIAVDRPSTSSPPPTIVVVERQPPTFDRALEMAAALAPSMSAPSDCELPLDDPASMPNSPRAYRSGVHGGLDFICGETGRSAWAAMQGRAVVAVGEYRDPTPDDRQAVLAIASEVGRTPAHTLTMLFGNHVIVDHGVIDDVGHVTTISAHLADVDSDLEIGRLIEGGTRLGEIGNLGTASASSGVPRARSLHLHWEIHVDGLPLGFGLTTEETREVYARLFAG